MAMYIISGKHRGRRIESPEGRDIRPTTARIREAVFNILAHGKFSVKNLLPEARVADIFCGSGAMGLEAFSRGAAHVTFVDKSREALVALEHNLEKFGEAQNAALIRTDSSNLPPAAQPYDILLLDPPYHTGLGVNSLNTARKGGWLHDATVAVLEQAWREPVNLPEGYRLVDERKYGNTRIMMLQPVPGG